MPYSTASPIGPGGGTVTGPILLPDGSAAAPALAFADDTNTGIFSIVNDAVSISTGNAESFRVQPNGTGISAFSMPLNVGAAATPGRLLMVGGSGGIWEHFVATENLTLNTGGTTTNTSANLLPANAIIEAVNTRVTTTITTAVSFSVGDSTTAARFSASAGGMTAGSTRIGLDHWSGAVASLAAGPSQAAAASVRITCNANPGAGAIRIQVFYRVFTAPTS
jgi:hypothetical protein